MALNAQSVEKISPADYYIGMDYDIRQTEVYFEFNKKPMFAMDVPFGGRAGSISQINFNNMLHPQQTKFTFRVKMLDVEGDNLESSVKLRLYYWPANDNGYLPFDETPYGYATEVYIALDEDENGNEVVVYTDDVRGQEYMRASNVRHVSGDLKREEWIEFELDLSYDFAFLPREWVNGEVLKNNEKTKQQVIEEYRKTYELFASRNKDAIFEFYSKLDAEFAQSYGRPVGYRFDDAVWKVFFESEFNPVLDPFNSDESKLVLYGNGRLATLLPTPIVFSSPEYGGEGKPMLFFYKDSSGKWHLAD